MTWPTLNRRLAGILASTCLMSGALAQTTYYVDGSCGSDSWTGTDEICTAPIGPKQTIQAALDVAANGDEIIVADGTYSGSGNDDLDFSGRRILLRSANGPGACTIDAQGFTRVFHFRSAETRESVVEGFTITGGATNQELGAGISCSNGSPTIRECIITNNSAGIYNGGGIYVGNGNTPLIEECVITNNIGGGGAAIFCENSSPTIISCVMSGNVADIGGAVLCTNSNAVFINCLFTDNEATSAPWGGGAIFCNAGSVAEFTNCTFTANRAIGVGGGLYSNRGSAPVLTNCILWGDTQPEIEVSLNSGQPSVTYSAVEGGYQGIGNIMREPPFVDPASGNFALLGGWQGIDAGNNRAVPSGIVLDLAGNPRLVDDPATPNTGIGPAPVVDMGAYEFQGESCYADCDQSTGPGVLDLFDFLCFQGSFVSGEPYACDCDTSTGPLVCDLFDFLCFQGAFVGGCP